jgi:hypothetical protein
LILSPMNPTTCPLPRRTRMTRRLWAGERRAKSSRLLRRLGQFEVRYFLRLCAREHWIGQRPHPPMPPAARLINPIQGGFQVLHSEIAAAGRGGGCVLSGRRLSLDGHPP